MGFPTAELSAYQRLSAHHGSPHGHGVSVCAWGPPGGRSAGRGSLNPDFSLSAALRLREPDVVQGLALSVVRRGAALEANACAPVAGVGAS